ncbi:hypothetical protein BXZ70DRAFT_932795 [Cristinia sonorae]|uniref:MYND-type domain-containing protein n=1 Tax=Cristinia sonorae TaxID=1940300 RepID=A0A8K0XQR5_9AGAR|nr:hypothetical protein BXZ70DRAFT_932795 [Cristinia sonorae]
MGNDEYDPTDNGIDYPLPPIDSKETRQLCRQCQKCWKRRTAMVKLFVCSSCKITSYCSKQCQKEDWRDHKGRCRENTERRKRMAEMDELTKTLRELTGEDDDLPLMSTVNDELGEFLKRFRAMICRAGYCCLKISQNPDAWAKYVFRLRIERIKNPSRESRPWERYKVVGGEAVSIDALLKKNDSFRDLIPQFLKYNEENVKVGCVGTVTTFLECDSAGADVRCVSWGGYGEDSWDDVAPGEDWLVTIKEEVERLSGRTTK